MVFMMLVWLAGVSLELQLASLVPWHAVPLCNGSKHAVN